MIREISKIDGIKGFYKGFTLDIYGVFVYRGFYFGLWEIAREYIKGRHFGVQFLVA